MPTESGTPANNQNATSGQQQQPTQSSTVANPWEGVDLNDLPDDVRPKIEAAKAAFDANQTKATDLEKQLTASTEFARANQSRADKAVARLQAHNIPLDGNIQQQQQGNPLREKFIADGLKPEVADGYVKMFESNNEIQRQQILGSLGPLANTVAGIQATQLLSDAKFSHKEVFAVESVSKQINDNIAILLQQGTPVDKSTMDHLMDMAWGKYIRENPDAIKPKGNILNTPVPSFGNNGLTTGSHVSQQQNANANAPVATQAETVTVMNALNAELRRGMPAKKGGK